MADERDPKVSQRYRELGEEEPPPALDQTVLAAADRGKERPHAPLVTPAGRHRWYYALGAAAILVLAVAVTVQMERERPDAESAPATPAAEARKEQFEYKPPPEPPPPIQQAAPPVAPVPPKAPPAPKAAPAPKPQVQARPREEAPSRATVAGVGVADEAVVDTPERWIERIVQLRKDGRDEEAERQLTEFRKRYPDYKIPEAALR